MKTDKLTKSQALQAKFGEQIKSVAQGLRLPYSEPDDILNLLKEADPTPNKRFLNWLVREFLRQSFSLKDLETVKSVLSEFSKIKHRLPASERDVNKYSFLNLKQRIEKFSSLEFEINESHVGRIDYVERFEVDPEEVSVLYNGPYGLLIRPLTEKASCLLGRGTKWCTASTKSDNDFNEYNEKGPLYIWIDKSGEKFQFSFATNEFRDQSNENLEPEILRFFRNRHPVLSKFFKENEKQLVNNPVYLVSYINSAIGERWPEVEPVILTDSNAALYYARDVIKGRWPEAENIICQNAIFLVLYVLEVVKTRWPEVEDIILQSSDAAYHYANGVIKDRWLEAEPIISCDPYAAMCYARDVIKGRWPEAEKTILKNNYASVWYAKEVIGSRWLQAETNILKDSYVSVWYARDVIKGRWPEAEEIISRDSEYSYMYAKDVIKGRWLETEKTILGNIPIAYEYLKQVVKGRWPEAEYFFSLDMRYWQLYREFCSSLSK